MSFDMSTADEKALLRKSIRAARREISDDVRRSSAEAVAESLLKLEGIKTAEVILAYMPMKYELDILPAVERLKALGKRIAFPLCIEDGGLKLLIPAEENGFKPGAYGILEPDTDTANEISASALDAIILPAVGFDRKLMRLGQGGGYYDRLLKRTDCFKAAVGFDCQLVDSVPTEENDMPVDAVVTPSLTIAK